VADQGSLHQTAIAVRVNLHRLNRIRTITKNNFIEKNNVALTSSSMVRNISTSSFGEGGGGMAEAIVASNRSNLTSALDIVFSHVSRMFRISVLV